MEDGQGRQFVKSSLISKRGENVEYLFSTPNRQEIQQAVTATYVGVQITTKS